MSTTSQNREPENAAGQDRQEHTPWWFWLPGRRGNDGLTRRQRRWYAESFERTFGRKADHSKAIAVIKERRRTNGS